MRAFISIDLPDELKEKLASFQEELKKKDILKGKFVEKENLHLALKFLGEISEQEANKISEVLEELCKKQKAFILSLKGIGAFPSESYVRVCWIGIDKGSYEIKELSKKINKAIGSKEENEFIGHITLARVKAVLDKKKLAELFEKYRNAEFGRFEVRSIKLMKSELTEKGPIYSLIDEFHLSP